MSISGVELCPGAQLLRGRRDGRRAIDCVDSNRSLFAGCTFERLMSGVAPYEALI